MLNKEFDKHEKIFRAIKKFPNWWKPGINRPSSAAFKDSHGASVDRQGGRTTSESAQVLFDQFLDLKAVVHISFEDSSQVGAIPHYDPIVGNVFHSILQKNDGTIPLSSSIAEKLSKKVEIFIPE